MMTSTEYAKFTQCTDSNPLLHWLVILTFCSVPLNMFWKKFFILFRPLKKTTLTSNSILFLTIVSHQVQPYTLIVLLALSPKNERLNIVSVFHRLTWTRECTRTVYLFTLTLHFSHMAWNKQYASCISCISNSLSCQKGPSLKAVLAGEGSP